MTRRGFHGERPPPIPCSLPNALPLSAPETHSLPTDPEALIAEGVAWFEDQGWFPFPFQLEAWEAWLRGESGIVNAPTGSGKTYSLMMPALLEARHRPPGKRKGPLLLWITPIRALAREIRDKAAAAEQQFRDAVARLMLPLDPP